MIPLRQAPFVVSPMLPPSIMPAFQMPVPSVPQFIIPPAYFPAAAPLPSTLSHAVVPVVQVTPPAPAPVLKELVPVKVPVRVEVEVIKEVEVAPIVNQNVTLYQPRPQPSLTVVPYPREWYYSEELKVRQKQAVQVQSKVMAQTIKTVNLSISNGDDDCEEKLSTGKTSLHDDDLDLREGRLVGIRFEDVQLKPRQVVKSAVLQFHAKLDKSDNCHVNIYGENSGHAAGFSHHLKCLSGRPKTNATVPWALSPWTPGSCHSTGDVAPIVQEILNHSQWQAGNSMVFILEGLSGHRSAWAFDGNPSLSPMLIVKVVEEEMHEVRNARQASIDVPPSPGGSAKFPRSFSEAADGLHQPAPSGVPPMYGAVHNGTGPEAHDGYDALGHARQGDHGGDPWQLPRYAHPDQHHETVPHHQQLAHLIYEDKFRYPRYNLSHECLRPTRLERQIPESARPLVEQQERQEAFRLAEQARHGTMKPPVHDHQSSIPAVYGLFQQPGLRSAAAMALDAADGIMDGKYFGARILEPSPAALALDAADGVMDGKYFGAPIFETSVISPPLTRI